MGKKNDSKKRSKAAHAKSSQESKIRGNLQPRRKNGWVGE